MDIDSFSFHRRLLDDLYNEMIQYYEGDPKRIMHLTKVHSFARLIAVGEKLDDDSRYILEAAAYTHDIGIKAAEEKYGSCDGKLQEQEGPIIAQNMLQHVGFDNFMIERVCYLIGNHHSYDHIDGLDYQILVEADFIVNLYEDHASESQIDHAFLKIFKTETGKELFQQIFGIRYE